MWSRKGGRARATAAARRDGGGESRARRDGARAFLAGESASAAQSNNLGAQSLDHLRAMAQTFSRDTHVQNRDGTSGIAAHFDSLLDGPAARTETVAGDWGGSSCVFNYPPCTSDASCPNARPGSCCSPGGTLRSQACGGIPPGHCQINVGPDSSGEDRAYDAGPRRWLFRTMHWDGGGSARPLGMIMSVGNASDSVHELAHTAALDHGGPQQARFDADTANFSLVHLSRIQYDFQNVGGVDLGDSIEAARIGFSLGLNGSVPSLAAPEACAYGANAESGPRSPYGLVGDYSFRGSGLTAPDGIAFAAGGRVCTQDDHDAVCEPHVSDPTCRGAVDWNGDGEIAPRGATVEAPVLSTSFARVQRTPGTFGGTPQRWLSETGTQLVAAGGVLFRVRVEGIAVGAAIRPRLLVNLTRSFACSPDPNPDLRPGQFRWPDCDWEGSQLGPLEASRRAIEPLAVAAASTRLGGRTVLVVVWVPLDAPSTLRYGLMETFGQFRASPTAIPLGAAGLASLDDLSGIPSLARIGETDDLVLTFRDANGDIGDVVGRPTATDVTWTPRGEAAIASGTLAFRSAVATASLPVTTLLPADYGVILAVGRTQGEGLALELFARSTGRGAWDALGPIEVPNGSRLDTAGIRGRPAIAARPYRVGSSAGDATSRTRWRLALSYQVDGLVNASSGQLPRPAELFFSHWDDLGTWDLIEDFNAGGAVSTASPSAVAIVWDDATGGAAHGLRAEYGITSVNPCNGNRVSDGSCPVGTTCCALGASCLVLPNSPSSPQQAQRPRGCFADPIGSTGIHLVQATRTLPIGAEGVVPFTAEDFDEWPAMLAGFCQGMRYEQASFAPCMYADTGPRCPAPGSASAVGIAMRACPTYARR